MKKPGCCATATRRRLSPRLGEARKGRSLGSLNSRLVPPRPAVAAAGAAGQEAPQARLPSLRLLAEPSGAVKPGAVTVASQAGLLKAGLPPGPADSASTGPLSESASAGRGRLDTYG